MIEFDFPFDVAFENRARSPPPEVSQDAARKKVTRSFLLPPSSPPQRVLRRGVAASRRFHDVTGSDVTAIFLSWRSRIRECACARHIPSMTGKGSLVCLSCVCACAPRTYNFIVASLVEREWHTSSAGLIVGRCDKSRRVITRTTGRWAVRRRSNRDPGAGILFSLLATWAMCRNDDHRRPPTTTTTATAT